MSHKVGEWWWFKSPGNQTPQRVLRPLMAVERPLGVTAIGPTKEQPVGWNIWLIENQADWNDKNTDTIMRLKPAEVNDILQWAGLKKDVTHGDASE